MKLPEVMGSFRASSRACGGGLIDVFQLDLGQMIPALTPPARINIPTRLVQGHWSACRVCSKNIASHLWNGRSLPDSPGFHVGTRANELERASKSTSGAMRHDGNSLLLGGGNGGGQRTEGEWKYRCKLCGLCKEVVWVWSGLDGECGSGTLMDWHDAVDRRWLVPWYNTQYQFLLAT